MGWFSRKPSEVVSQVHKPITTKYQEFIQTFKNNTENFYGDDGKVSIPVSFENENAKLIIYLYKNEEILLFNPFSKSLNLKVFYNRILHENENDLECSIHKDICGVGPKSLSRLSYYCSKHCDFLISSIVNTSHNIETLLWSGKALITGSSNVNELFG